MGISGEYRRRFYGEERVREEGREEIQREIKRRKQKQVSLGSLAIIAIVVAVGLPAILLGCNGESTPQTTAGATAEATPVPPSILSDAAFAALPPKGGGFASGTGEATKPLEFITLRERSLEGGGVGAEILVDEVSSKRDVRILGEYILWKVWPKKHFSVLVYDSKEAWEARGLCEQAHEGEPAAKFDEIEGGPICTSATQLEKEHLLLTISRNPSTFQAEALWIGPDRPEVLSDTQ